MRSLKKNVSTEISFSYPFPLPLDAVEESRTVCVSLWRKEKKEKELFFFAACSPPALLPSLIGDDCFFLFSFHSSAEHSLSALPVSGFCGGWMDGFIFLQDQCISV